MNTIYQYYRKVSDRYYIGSITNDLKVIHRWDLMAKGISLPGLEDFDLFLSKEGNYFNVCEALTGIILIRQRDLESREMRMYCMKSLIDYLPAEIAIRGGRGWINRTANDFILDTGKISPRYKRL